VPWTLIDYNVTRLSSKPCVLGSLESVVGEVQITFDPVPVNQLWRIERLSYTCLNPSGSKPKLTVYDLPVNPPGTGTVSGLVVPNYTAIPAGIVPVTGSRDGDFDSGDFASPITIIGGASLVLAWEYVEVGVVANARCQYALYQGSPAQPQPVAGAQSARVNVPTNI
jgi:hypothetical protein